MNDPQAVFQRIMLAVKDPQQRRALAQQLAGQIPAPPPITPNFGMPQVQPQQPQAFGQMPQIQPPAMGQAPAQQQASPLAQSMEGLKSGK